MLPRPMADPAAAMMAPNEEENPELLFAMRKYLVKIWRRAEARLHTVLQIKFYLSFLMLGSSRPYLFFLSIIFR